MSTSPSYLKSIFQGSNTRGVIAAIASISIVGTGIGLSFPLLSLLMEQRGIAASIIGANTAVAGIAAMMVVPFVTPLARKLGVVNSMISLIVTSIFLPYRVLSNPEFASLVCTEVHFQRQHHGHFHS